MIRLDGTSTTFKKREKKTKHKLILLDEDVRNWLGRAACKTHTENNKNGTHVMITSENVVNILNKLIECDFDTVLTRGKTTYQCSGMLKRNKRKQTCDSVIRRKTRPYLFFFHAYKNVWWTTSWVYHFKANQQKYKILNYELWIKFGNMLCVCHESNLTNHISANIDKCSHILANNALPLEMYLKSPFNVIHPLSRASERTNQPTN